MNSKVARYLLNQGVEKKLQITTMRLLNLIVIEVLEKSDQINGGRAVFTFLPLVGSFSSAIETMVQITVLKNLNLKKLAAKLEVEERSINRAMAELIEHNLIRKNKSEVDKRVALYNVLLPKELVNDLMHSK